MTSNIYIDCNRQNSNFKSDDATNEWEHQLVNTLRIPMGSQIKINNSMINYKGLQGGSIEITDDTQITFSFSYYISDSDFLVPQSSFNDSNDANSPTAPANPWCKETLLKTTAWDCFSEVNTYAKMSAELAQDLQKRPDGSVAEGYFGTYQYLIDRTLYGGTEQPLFAVVINENFLLQPLIGTLSIPISKGTYGITQFTNLVQDFINGTRIPQETNNITNTDGFKSQFQLDYETYKWGQNNQTITSKFCTNRQAFNNTYVFSQPAPAPPLSFNTFSDITQKTTDEFMYNETTINNKVLFITARDYNFLMNAYSFNYTNLPASYTWSVWRQNHYYASIWTPYYTNNARTIAQTDPLTYDYRLISNDPLLTITQDNVAKAPSYWDYDPFRNGFYLGTSDFQFNYDTELNSFSFSFLHSPRRIDEYDRVGNKNDQSGKIVSYIKKDVTLSDRMNLGEFFVQPIENQILVKNSIYNPRQRNGGIMIYNFDVTVSLENQNRYPQNSPLNNTGPQQLYKRFIDFFTDPVSASKAWEKSLLFQLGFTYNSLNNPLNMEIVNSYDLLPITLYGMTTNNVLDITSQSSLANLYCPQESVITKNSEGVITDYGYINWANSINSQVKCYDLQSMACNKYAIGNFNINNWKYVYYTETSCFPVLTTSQTINATKLPTLSKLGYFIITSDIFNSQDECGENAVMPILGIVNKSNLSNQDFITSYNDIVHNTTRDIILNKIKIKILNSDLTAPNLDPYSSILLQITLAPQKIKDGFLI